MATNVSADLATMDAGELRMAAATLLPGYTPELLGAIPPESLRIDLLVAQWNRNPDLVPPGYSLGHCHGFSPESDAGIKREQPAQLAMVARAHAESGLAWRFDRTVERANQLAGQLFTERIQAAAFERVTADADLLALVRQGQPELEQRIREQLGIGPDDDLDPLDPQDALGAVRADPNLALAAGAFAQTDPAALAYIMAADPELVQDANAAARQLAVETIQAFEQQRDTERAEIAGMAERLAQSAPRPETDPQGERGVLLDLQTETWQQDSDGWVTHRIYRWATYPELIDGGPGIVGELRSALDQHSQDPAYSGGIRIWMW